MLLKDFSKMETFLSVVREKSFSKASAKLGISQPAVTQQIKFIEEYLDTKIIERKKNGVILTKNGEKLLPIVQKLERCIANTEKEIMKIINKDVTFTVGSSFTIGNYVLPLLLNNIKDNIKNDVFVKIADSEHVLNDLEDKKIDLALIESPIFRENITYREWIEDELVLFSNSPLPKVIKKEDLYTFKWVCREWGSHTRRLVNESLEEMGVDCSTFDVKSVVNSSTAIKQTILKSEIDRKSPTVAILSRCVIEDEVAVQKLFEARIKGKKLTRNFYIAYLKDRKNDPFIESVVGYMMTKRSV